MSVDTEALRREALGQLGRIAADPRWPGRVLSLLDLLAAAEHRATRAEAQSAIRGRAVVIYRERAREAEAERDWNIRSSRSAKKGRIGANARAESAEARIKAVQDLIDQADTAGDWAITCSRLQWAIDGTGPYRASEGK